MQKIRIAHYGIGHDHSAQFMQCVKHMPELYEIVGICEPNLEIREKFGSLPVYKGFKWLTEEELFSRTDIDAVLVEAFDLDLVSYAQKCADKGWHIHMDKAAGTNLSAYRRLLDTVKEKNLVFQVGYMFRYNPMIRQGLAAKESGELGEIYHIDAFMNTGFPTEKRRWLSQLPGGDMLYLGCHMIDLTYLFWGQPKRVIPFNKRTLADGVDCVDNACAVLEYDRGVALIRASAVEQNGFGRRQFVVCGENATYEVSPLEGPPKVRITKKEDADPYEDKATEQIAEGYSNSHRYVEMMQDFASYVRGEKTNPFTVEYEYQVQKLTLDACGLPSEIQS